MTKNFISSAFLFISFIVFGSFTNQNEDLQTIFVKINNEVNQNSKAFETLSEACKTIGHRLTGSPNGKKAEEFAYNLLKNYGFQNVKYNAFEQVAWSRDTVSLQIAPESSDDFRNVEVTALASTPVFSNLEGIIVDMGNGLEADFENSRQKVEGKVVLMNLGLVDMPKGTKNLHRSEKTELAIKNGAVGVIMVNQIDGNVLLTGTASVTGELIKIPAVCIAKESGLEIRSWMKENPKLLAIINMKNFSKKIKARNVIATIPGTSLAHEKIIIGGHLDSWDLATGAMDNGIGSFSVLDIARTFKALKIRSKRTIEFVMFMGEEQGLFGSKALVKSYLRSNKMTGVKYMINLDMVNNVKGFNLGGRKEMIDYMKNIGEIIKTIEPHFKNEITNYAHLHSDHQSFMLEGIPTMEPNGSFSVNALGCYHANCDKMDIIDKKEMENTVKYTAMMLYTLANEKDLKAKRINSEENRQFLTDMGLKNELVIAQEWRWK